MVRQSIFCLKICVFPKSRTGENEQKTALLREKSRGGSKTGKHIRACPFRGYFSMICSASSSLLRRSCAVVSARKAAREAQSVKPHKPNALLSPV